MFYRKITGRLRLFLTVAMILIALAGVYSFLTSSFLFCNCYLPILSRCLDVRITARNVRFLPLGKQNLRIKDLKIEIPDKLIYNTARLKAQVSLWHLLRGRLAFDNVQTTDSMVLMFKMPSGSGGSLPEINTDNIRIGKVRFSDLSIRYAPDHSPVYFRLDVDSLQCNSLASDRDNILTVQTRLAWKTPASASMHFPVNGTVHFRLDRNFYPQSVSGLITLEHPDADFLHTDLSQLNLRAEFEAARTEKGIIHLDKFKVVQQSEGREEFSLTADGVYNINNQTGGFQIVLASENSNLYLPEDICGTYFSLKNLSLNCQTEFKLKGTQTTCVSSLRATADCFETGKICQLEKVLLTSNFNGWFDLLENSLSIRELSMDLRQKDKQLASVNSSGIFNMKKNPDGTWNAGTTSSSISAYLFSADLNLLSPFVPFQINDGKVDMEYKFVIDPKKEQILGTVYAHGMGIDISCDSFSLPRQNASLETRFYSRGLTDIKELIIPYFRIKSKSGNKTPILFQLNGRYLVPEQTAVLNGSTELQVVPLLSQVQEVNVRKALNKLQKYYPDNELKWNINSQLRLHIPKKILYFTGNSSVNLTFLKEAGVKDTLAQTFLNGEIQYQGNTRDIRLKNFEIRLQDILDFNLSARAQLPHPQWNVSLNLNMFRPALLRGLFYIYDPELYCVNQTVRKLDFQNIELHSDVILNTRDFEIAFQKLFTAVHYGKKRNVSFEITKPLYGSMQTWHFRPSTGKLYFHSYPLSANNVFVFDHTGFLMSDADINGFADFDLKDFLWEMQFDVHFNVEKLAFEKSKKRFYFGDCEIHGKGLFSGLFSQMKYWDASALCRNPEGKEASFWRSNAVIHFRGERAAEFHVDCDFMNELAWHQFFPGYTDKIHLKHLKSSGKFYFAFNHIYDDMLAVWDQKIDELEFYSPEKSDFKPDILHGKIHLHLQDDEYGVLYTKAKDCVVELKDSKEKSVLHLFVDGAWDRTAGKARSNCIIRSDAWDLQTFLVARKGSREYEKKYLPELFNTDYAVWTPLSVSANQNKPSSVQSAPSPAQSATLPAQSANYTAQSATPKDKESPANPDDGGGENGLIPLPQKELQSLDFFDQETKVLVQAKNWNYGNLLKMNFSGEVISENDTLKAKEIRATINDADLHIELFADVSKKDGWPIRCLVEAHQLDIAPFVQIFGNQENSENKKVTGIVKTFHLSGKTKGLAIDNLNKNLELKVLADVEKLSFPTEDQSKFSFFKISLLPVSVVLPLVIDKIPASQSTKKMLNRNMSDVVAILRGDKNMYFDRTQIAVHSSEKQHTDLVVEKCLLDGPLLKITSERATLNPFLNQMDFKSVTKFSGILIPVHLHGTLTKPESDDKYTYQHILQYNLLPPSGLNWNFMDMTPWKNDEL